MSRHDPLTCMGMGVLACLVGSLSVFGLLVRRTWLASRNQVTTGQVAECGSARETVSYKIKTKKGDLYNI